MGWMPDFGYIKGAYKDSDDNFKFIKKSGQKKSQGPLGKRLDQNIKSLIDVNQKPKGLI
jgi:hypothetical protein